MRYLMKMTCLGIAAMLLAATAPALTVVGSETVIPLYSKETVSSLGVPEIREQDAEGDILMVRNVSEPALELFRPAPGNANDTAVIVAPGGGFVGLVYEVEGAAVARRLAESGVTAFVLKYRTIQSDADPMQMPEVHMKEMDHIAARTKSGVPVEIPPFAGEKNATEDGVRVLASYDGEHLRRHRSQACWHARLFRWRLSGDRPRDRRLGLKAGLCRLDLWWAAYAGARRCFACLHRRRGQ